MSDFISRVLRLVMPVSRAWGSTETNSTYLPKPSHSTNEMLSVDLPLPEDIIIIILSFVPAEDLLENCIYISEWKELIEGQNLWHIKCENEGILIPKRKPADLPKNFYRATYLVPYGRNLVKNSCGSDGFNGWQMSDEETDPFDSRTTFIVENPPAGADLVPDSECQSCFSTTYYWCKKFQKIDLLAEVGGFSEILDEIKPPIEVSEWYAARFDCGSVYHFCVLLLDESDNVLDNFEFEHTEPQWSGQRWEQVKHVFKDYPTGVRSLKLEHSGKDTQFWAGHFGSKMTKSKVIFQLST